MLWLNQLLMLQQLPSLWDLAIVQYCANNHSCQMPRQQMTETSNVNDRDRT